MKWPWVRRSRMERAIAMHTETLLDTAQDLQRTKYLLRHYEKVMDEAERYLQVIDPEHRADPDKCVGCGCTMQNIAVQAAERIDHPERCWRPVPEKIDGGAAPAGEGMGAE